MSKAKSVRRCSASSPLSGLFDDEAVIGEALGDRLAQRGLVVDDQQMFLAFSHLVRVGGILTPAVRRVNSRAAANPIAAARVFRYISTYGVR